MNLEYIFVYGTLQQHARHPLHRQLCRYCILQAEATMQGCLFEVSGYPGAIESPHPTDRIKGEIYLIRDSKPLFAVLDDYEECSDKFPMPHEYRRKKIPIRTIQGDTVSAWAYIYCRSTTPLRKIPGGDYLRFLRQQKRQQSAIIQLK